MKNEWITAIIFLAVSVVEKFSGLIPSFGLHLLYWITLVFVILGYKKDYMWNSQKVFSVITIIYKSNVLGAVLFSSLNYPGKFWLQAVALILSVGYALVLYFYKNNSKAAAEVFFYNQIASGIFIVGN